MPARLDRVTITLWRGPVELPWDSRTQLIDEMSHLDSAADAIRAFNGAGASAPVRLGRDDKEMIARLIDRWAEDADENDLPPGIWGLRCALLDDLTDVPGRPGGIAVPDAAGDRHPSHRVAVRLAR